jgi:hypothetical protein
VGRLLYCTLQFAQSVDEGLAEWRKFLEVFRHQSLQNFLTFRRQLND